MTTTVITGGCGFLGRKLAERLAADQPERSLVLVDQSPPPDDWVVPAGDVEIVLGDLADPGFIERGIPSSADTIFHLASVVSSGAEADFDLGYAVNLLGTIALLERCRRMQTESGRPPIFVFTSSLATFGSGAGNPVDDSTALRPETSYGVQKASCELLINDYTRKGFLDGRVVRLPTVVVRPGKPNLAASGFASGIIREPLRGVDMVCPVAPETVMAVISPRRVIDAFCRVITIAGEELGPDRTVLLPGLAMSMADAVEATKAGGGSRDIGNVRFAPDPEIQRIISSWPPSMVSARATELGFVGDSSVATIVRQHIEDELES